MRKLIRLLLAFICVFAITATNAQTVTVEIKVTHLYSNYGDGDSYGSRFRFYKDGWVDDYSHLLSNYCTQCESNMCIKRPEAFDQNEDFILRTFTMSATSSFDLGMVTHDERKEGSSDCTSEGVSGVTWRKPDTHQKDSWIYGISPANYPPGKFVPLGTIDVYEGGTHTYATLQIRYTIPTPAQPVRQPVVSPAPTTFCANDVLELRTNVTPNNTDLQYEWQYALQSEDYDIWNPAKDPDNHWDPDMNKCGKWIYFEGDPSWPPYFQESGDPNECDLDPYIKTQNWKILPITNSSSDRSAFFTPQQAIFNNNISTVQNAYFRVRAISSDSKTSEYSPFSIYTFLPPPPAIIESRFVKKPSCLFPNNGRLEIPYNAISTPFQKVRWLVKNGWNNDKLCKVIINTSNNTFTSDCGVIEKQSPGLVDVPKSANAAPIVIDSLPPGQYTLWLINQGETTGNCYQPINIKIDTFPPLTLTQQSANNLTCFQSNDGKFSLKADGGDPNSGYQFKLTAKKHPELNTGYVTITGNLFERTGLPADVYTINMKNACTPEVNMEITLTEPTKTVGSAVFNQPSCYSPADGGVVVEVSQGMGSYIYQLFKDGVKTELPATPDVKHVFGNLLPATYQVKVLDAARIGCPGVDTTVVLQAPPPLTATVQQRDSVTCYGGSDGAILIKGDGGTGRHVFTLKNGNTTLSSNNTGSFTGLTAGNYQVILSKPADENCDDSFALPVAVPTRSPLNAILAVAPVTCKGKDNGIVIAMPSGGSGSYSYYWEYWDGTAWKHNNFWFPTDIRIIDLTPGRYRVTLSDNKAAATCTFTSQDITVVEPALLEITKVQTTDAACKADGGRINITATGGNGGYIYYYAIGSPTSNYTAFTANTPLTINADYYIKVEDAKGCTVEDSKAYPISLPPVPMDFTLQASDYEGTSVACFNGNNGIITIAASGGSETGYEYALGAGAFQPTPEFKQLTAGTYNVSVKDLRGCVLSKNISLSQPAQPLQGTITNKREVYCPGTPTGSFDIAIQYGRAPYQYSIDNGVTFQSSNTFTGIYTGTYQVVVKDKYDCRWTTSVTVVSTIPVVKYVNTIKNVSCFNGNDGSVLVSASGGQPPYQYNWLGKNNTTAQLGTLSLGQYILQVTDGAGCVSQDTVQIKQPAAPLTAVTTTQPVCVGSNGSITMNAAGGTPPYRYSADNGATFQNDPVLGNLPAATYSVVVRDANNCQAGYSVVINPANPMPEINFLVASGRYALDTLVIKEVSVPIPDSVHWRFDPAAQILDNSASPQIRFNNAGNYWVDMTGFFKGCAYTIRKTINLKPYDPEAGLVYTPPIAVIDTVTLYPNPNNGQFSVHVKLNKKQKMIMLVQDMGSGREIMRRTYEPVLATDDYFSLTNMSNGTYVLRVIAENDSRDVQFVINR